MSAMLRWARVALQAPAVPPASAEPGISEAPRPGAGPARDTDAVEASVIVGGCAGLLCLPAAQQAAYYRGQGYMAMLGLACLSVHLVLWSLF